MIVCKAWLSLPFAVMKFLNLLKKNHSRQKIQFYDGTHAKCARALGSITIITKSRLS